MNNIIQLIVEKVKREIEKNTIKALVGKIGLNYYKEQESIESLFNSYWEEMQS